MIDKKSSRQRRSRRSRIKMRELGATRLTVHRTPRHIYAQIIAPAGNEIVVQASSLDASMRVESKGNVETAKKVGSLIASRAKEAGVNAVAFDRAGFKYHGRVRALADAAREAGLEF